ncbi:MAG: Mfa1 family fimbria major subunit [Tannerellaceae bacterium]|jgi:hypothetical protein|nr:Mfa1 family fimbria major subunit [Tannerellaceae bacterium]
MKKTFKYCFMLGAVLLAGLTGCSKEVIIDGDTTGKEIDGKEGVSTYATFNFVINGADTKASDMIDDVSETDKISDIRLIIFKTGAATTCEVNEVYDASTTGWDAKKSKTVQLTSGTKRIFVITNALKNKSVNSLVDTTAVVVGKTTLAQFYDVTYDLGTVSNNVLADINKIKDVINKTDGYVMSNTLSAKSSFLLRGGIGMDESREGKNGEKENNFSIQIQRTVAKACVFYKESKVLNTTDKTGTLSALKYTFQNVNRALHPFQKFASDMVDPAGNMPHSPYYSLAAGAAQVTYDTTYFSGYNFADVTTKDEKCFYITENTSETPRNGTTTYAAIESVFLPKKGMVADTCAFNKTLGAFEKVTFNKNDMTTAATLYKLVDVGNVKGVPANIFFTDKTLAYTTAYCIKNGKADGFDISKIDELKWDGATGKGYIVEYAGGKSYHRLNIGENNAPNFIPGVKRNNVYQANITSFAGIGVPNIKDLNKDPDKPIGQKTHVTATISVLSWSKVPTDHEL